MNNTKEVGRILSKKEAAILYNTIMAIMDNKFVTTVDVGFTNEMTGASISAGYVRSDQGDNVVWEHVSIQYMSKDRKITDLETFTAVSLFADAYGIE